MLELIRNSSTQSLPSPIAPFQWSAYWSTKPSIVPFVSNFRWYLPFHCKKLRVKEFQPKPSQMAKSGRCSYPHFYGLPMRFLSQDSSTKKGEIPIKIQFQHLFHMRNLQNKPPVFAFLDEMDDNMFADCRSVLRTASSLAAATSIFAARAGSAAGASTWLRMARVSVLAVTWWGFESRLNHGWMVSRLV